MKKLLLLVSFLIGGLAFSQDDPKTPQATNIVIPSTKGCTSGNCDNGWGKWVYENGYYSGFWVNSQRSGYGLYVWNEAGKYIGWWENDERNGYGVYLFNENDELSGEWKNNEMNGLGLTFKDGKWQQGVFKNGNIETAYTFIDNKKESGCTAGDCQNKYGRFKWSNGDSFTGFFKNGHMYMGTYLFANGDKYVGMFSQDKLHGQGRMFFKDGEYYGGLWSNGLYHGKGYYHTKDLKPSKGIWSNGKLTTPF